MPDAVVVALITGACAIVAQLIISHTSNVKLFAEIERKSELSDEKLQGKIDVMNTKIEELTREVRAHNNFAQRMPVLEEKVSNLERRRSQ
jgi:uncharacterized membrane protein YukC